MRRFWRADQQDPFDFEDRITPRPPGAEDDLVWNGLCWTDTRVVKSETERIHRHEETWRNELEARTSNPQTDRTRVPPEHVRRGDWTPANLLKPQ